MINTDTLYILSSYKQEMKEELNSILQYWQQHTTDEVNGGFYGKINTENIADEFAPKGVVLNARILWAFSVAYAIFKNKNDLTIATRAFDYITDCFRDKEYGGVFWSVDYKGNPLEIRKQIYGLAFTIYGMSEYYFATQNETALQFAKELFHTIEQHSFDTANNGYCEAFNRDWKPLSDLRLSAKDVNASKTMNTHLHIIEAYANLYKVWQDETVKERIENLLFLFDNHFIDKQTNHLILFFNNNWEKQHDVISYGHDIEAAWLLLHCAETINNEHWIVIYRQHATAISDAASEGLDADGGLWYEYDLHHDKLIRQKHWWPQAEAMIGYLNAYQITKKESYLHQSILAWRFTQNYLLDRKNGEWFWGVDDTNKIMQNEDKAGFWKCPYHNARACLEVIRRIDILQHNMPDVFT